MLVCSVVLFKRCTLRIYSRTSGRDRIPFANCFPSTLGSVNYTTPFAVSCAVLAVISLIRFPSVCSVNTIHSVCAMMDVSDSNGKSTINKLLEMLHRVRLHNSFRHTGYCSFQQAVQSFMKSFKSCCLTFGN